MLPTENPWPAMIALLCLAVVCFIKWGTSRQSKPLILGLVFALLAGGCYLLDVYVKTPREIITQNVYDLTTAFQKQEVQKTLSYFSPNAKEKATIEKLLPGVHVGNDMRISDVSVTFKPDNEVAVSHFRANASVSVNVLGLNADVGYHPSRWELDWQREAGEWKIVKVHRLHPINGKEMGFLAGD